MASRPAPNAPSARRSVLALGAGLALAFASCHSVGASVYNLRELHHPDGTFRRSGRLLSDTQYLLRRALTGLTGDAERFQQRPDERIDDPPAEAFEELCDLARADSSDPEVRRQQIEWFAFLAVDSPWKLARERCVLELGRLGRVLGLGIEPDAGGEPATVEAVSAGLERILAGVNALRAQGFELGESQLAQGCRDLGALRLDRRAALSVLRGIAPLQDLLAADDARYAPLYALSEDVQQILVRRTLEEALRDPDPLVVATAIRASTSLFGGQVLGVFVAQMFEAEAEFDERVLLTVLELMRKRGLPEVPGGPRGDTAEAREASQLVFHYHCLQFLVETGTEHPEGRVRLAALRALRRVTEADFGPREELWRPWWIGEREQWLARINTLMDVAPPPPLDGGDRGGSGGDSDANGNES